MIYKTQLLVQAVFILFMTTMLNAQNYNRMKNQTITQQEQAVLQTIERMTLAFHNKNIEAVMSFYEPEALVIFEPEMPIKDPVELRAMFTNAFVINPIFTYSGHDIFVYGDMATHIAPWTMNGQAPDGTKITQTGLSVAILRKQENGEWLIIFDNPHGNFLMQKE